MKMQSRSVSLMTAVILGMSAVGGVSRADSAEMSGQLQQKIENATKDPSSRDINHLLQSLKTRSAYVLNQLRQYPDLKSYYYFFDPRGLMFSTQNSQQESMIQQMEFAKAELSDSKLIRLKSLKDELQTKITKLKERNVQLKTDLGEAVSSNELSWGGYLLTKIPVVNYLASGTRETLDAEILKNNQEIEQAQKEQDFVVEQLVLALRSYGIKIDVNQVKILFATVTGDQDLQIISAYDNVRKLTVLIQEQLKPGQTTVELGREYYGMYALMLASLIRIHENQLSQIKEIYLNKINTLIAKSKETKAQAEALLKGSTNDAILNSNIKANSEMITVSTHYQEYLESRAARIGQSIKERRQAYLEVLNTYKTYDVAQGILEIIQSSQANLNALDALSISELPQLVDLGNSNIIDQLTQVTLKISAP